MGYTRCGGSFINKRRTDEAWVGLVVVEENGISYKWFGSCSVMYLLRTRRVKPFIDKSQFGPAGDRSKMWWQQDQTRMISVSHVLILDHSVVK